MAGIMNLQNRPVFVATGSKEGKAYKWAQEANFDTIMLKGGEFGKHFHEDVIESAEVLSGKMLDKITGEVYHKNDVMHYEKGEHHTPIALEDTVLKVIFKP
ncbi:MAG: hypothetical protein ACPG5P_01090 [Saprospiraceae bacterium]